MTSRLYATITPRSRPSRSAVGPAPRAPHLRSLRPARTGSRAAPPSRGARRAGRRERRGNCDPEERRRQEPDVARRHRTTVGEIPDRARVVVSPGPLKGVLSAAGAAHALAAGLVRAETAAPSRARRRWRTAGKARRRPCAPLSAESGGRPRCPIRSGDRWRPASRCSQTGGRSWKRRRRSGLPASLPTSSIRCAPPAEGSAS